VTTRAERETAALALAELRATKLDRSFYVRDARTVARALVGAYLVHAPHDAPARAVRIVETEAYCGATDLACHARVGLTKRTRTLLGPPAHAYVYLIYGMYDCFNVTCLGEGRGHAVLVRGGEPIFGVDAASRADGPGKLTRALGITRAHDTVDLTGDTLFLAARARRPRIDVTARVGVGYAGEWADKPWRFVDAASPHASRPSPRNIGRGPVASKG
jgi:DNA-3-methyladenine glycosylase